MQACCPQHEPREETGSTDSPTDIFKENALTWEPIIIDIAEGSHALPKVRVVGTITIQNKLLIQHSLAKRK